MKRFKLDNRTLALLNAQVNLSQTFNHTLRSSPNRKVLPFSLTVERSTIETLFSVAMGSQRHTLTLPNSKKMHLRLADFIEEIANGPIDITAAPLPMLHADRRYGVFSAHQREQVFNLICTGGFLDLDLGFELPIQIAIHPCRTRTSITTIMSIGVKQPRSKCFTVAGDTVYMYEKVAESITHLAALATPAAHAA
ncbi:MAG TPA: hypothetical protein VGC62_16275 [Pseudomonas sp.]|uniref:hypothetical protein n=1 Tax=Pseudomonas sp. TaxID=306 RepID=UPI002ED82FDF